MTLTDHWILHEGNLGALAASVARRRVGELASAESERARCDALLRLRSAAGYGPDFAESGIPEVSILRICTAVVQTRRVSLGTPGLLSTQ